MHKSVISYPSFARKGTGRQTADLMARRWDKFMADDETIKLAVDA